MMMMMVRGFEEEGRGAKRARCAIERERPRFDQSFHRERPTLAAFRIASPFVRTFFHVTRLQVAGGLWFCGESLGFRVDVFPRKIQRTQLRPRGILPPINLTTIGSIILIYLYEPVTQSFSREPSHKTRCTRKYHHHRDRGGTLLRSFFTSPLRLVQSHSKTDFTHAYKRLPS